MTDTEGHPIHRNDITEAFRYADELNRVSWSSVNGQPPGESADAPPFYHSRGSSVKETLASVERH